MGILLSPYPFFDWILSAEFSSKLFKLLGGESWHQLRYFDTLLSLLILIKGGAKDGHFFFHSKVMLIRVKQIGHNWAWILTFSIHCLFVYLDALIKLCMSVSQGVYRKPVRNFLNGFFVWNQCLITPDCFTLVSPAAYTANSSLFWPCTGPVRDCSVSKHRPQQTQANKTVMAVSFFCTSTIFMVCISIFNN